MEGAEVQAGEGKVWRSPTGPVGPRRLVVAPSSAWEMSFQWSHSPGAAPRSSSETLECPDQHCHHLGINKDDLLER